MPEIPRGGAAVDQGLCRPGPESRQAILIGVERTRGRVLGLFGPFFSLGWAARFVSLFISPAQLP